MGFFESLIILVLATAISIAVNALVIQYSRKKNVTNHDTSIIRWSAVNKPALGGISFFALLALTLLTAPFTKYADVLLNPMFIGIALAATVGFVAGYLDDAKGTGPLLKFGSQILCVVILIASGVRITIFPVEFFNYALTFFWVVAVMNSLNMLDNMDGVTTICGIFILIAASFATQVAGESIIFSLLLITQIGTLSGFLFYNWNPSKMFMGDAGSQYLGALLAGVGILFFWNNQNMGALEIPSKQFLIVLLAFIIPITDTFTVSINRLMRGQSPFNGGRDHTTHHLVYLGFSDRQVAGLFLVINLISLVLIYIIIAYMNPWRHLYTAAFLLWFLLIFFGLYSITWLPKARNKFLASEKARDSNV